MNALTPTALALAQMIENMKHKPTYKLPEINEDDRIRVVIPKTRKHGTKRRGNKLHTKKLRRPE